MTQQTGTRVSVSTYSLSRNLGATYHDAPGANGARTMREPARSGSMTLLELPARIASAGIRTFEVSHPHLPDRTPAYLNELRGAIKDAGVELLSVLIEDGDITHPDHAVRDLQWMEGWIETASLLGAERARVIAGKAPYSPDALARSRTGLQQLAKAGKDRGVRVTTENWFDTLCCPDAVHALMDGLEGQIGLNLDFGNWSGPTKYDDLRCIAQYAESCHAKCDFPAPYQPDDEDFTRCLDVTRETHFSGAYTLIYASSGDDEWRGLAVERDMVLPYLS